MTFGHAWRRAVPSSAVLTLALTGCAVIDAPNCTLADAESGVVVAWAKKDFPENARFRLCSGRVCMDRVGTRDTWTTRVEVRLPDDIGARTVPVRFTVTSADGSRTLYARVTAVRLQRYAPNGESCDPIVWQAALRADPGAGLVPVE
ncbi:hypothetical protein [Streptomyces sp. NPDC001070]